MNFINVLSYFTKDASGAFSLMLGNLKRNSISCFSTFFMSLKMKIIGVHYGKNVTYNGMAQVERFPGSVISIGDKCVFNSNSLFNHRGIKRMIIQTGTSNAVIKIGNNCGFSGVSIVADLNVSIGNNVVVGANCIIGDRDGHADILHTEPRPIKISDNVFIGMETIILKGVIIGENSIIAAGSLLNKDIPANCIAGGRPAKVLKYRD